MTSDVLTFTLAQADEQIYYIVQCQNCRHVRQIDLAAMRAKLGDDYPFEKLMRRRWRCSSCQGRRIIKTTLWKEATTTSRLLEQILGGGST